jgi:hypothetical protein
MKEPDSSEWSLGDVVDAIADVRGNALLSDAGSNLTAISEQHYLQALAFLDLAQRAAKLAALHEVSSYHRES